MQIAIVGTGTVGRALGVAWARRHDISYGSRDPKSEQARTLASSSKQQVLDVKQAVAGAEVVLLAVPWAAALDTVRGAGNLAGKVIVDPINAFTPDLALSIGGNTSVAEEIGKAAPGAKVVKAFNTLGVGNLVNLVFEGKVASGFLCGDDPAAKATVSELYREAGFEPVDCGALRNARALEPLAMLWGQLAFVQNLGPNISLSLLTR